VRNCGWEVGRAGAVGAGAGVGCWVGFLIALGGPRLLVGGFFGILVDMYR
jgi:hypothetical protein